MISDKKIKINSLILIIYLYLHSILIPLNFFFNEGILTIVETSLIIMMSLYVMYINRDDFKVKAIILFLILVFLFSINIFIVDYKNYVYSVAIMILINIFIPIVIIGTQKIDFTIILNNWYKLSIRMSIVYLPILFVMRKETIIGYFELAQFVHLNSIILFYFIIVKKKYRIVPFILLIINFFMLATMGSRMVLIATLVTYGVIILILNTKDKLRYIIYSLLFLISSTVILLKVESILLLLLEITNKHGISSRNLTLLLQYVQGTEIKEISSGRDAIYPIAQEIIKKNYGRPQGLGVLRNATNGQYYHAHNMFLEFMLTFGVIAFIFFMIWWIIKFIYMWKTHINKDLFDFFVIISIPYFIRSLVGTYFLTDSFFLVAFSILFWFSNKEEEN